MTPSWTLVVEDLRLRLVANKFGPTRLGFGLLKFFEIGARLPRSSDDER